MSGYKEKFTRSHLQQIYYAHKSRQNYLRNVKWFSWLPWILEVTVQIYVKTSFKTLYEQCFSVAPDILHPVIRTHPVSGRRSIYISDNFFERFDQMTVSGTWWRSAGKSERLYSKSGDWVNLIAGWRKRPSQTIPHLMGKIVSNILWRYVFGQSKINRWKRLSTNFLKF